VRGPVRRLGDIVARRIAHEVRRRDPEPEWIDTSPPTTYAIYAQIALLASRYRSDASNLTTAELRVFSQNGEDGVLAEIFGRIGVGGSSFVEFGVGDGSQCNTRFLVDVLGWSGVYFESSAVAFERLHRRLTHREDVATVMAHVTPDNVDALFAAAAVPSDFDVLSIDIDGQDYWVWKALVEYRPRVVVIEYNSAIPPTERLVEPCGHRSDRTSYLGASLGALEKLAAVKGYQLVHTELAGINAFFVRDDLATLFSRDDVVHRGPNFGLVGSGLWQYPGREPFVEV